MLQALNDEHHVEGRRQILITEVTRMTGGFVCVAGIDIASAKMVRPLQPGGKNWEEAKWVNTGYLQVGNLVSCVAAIQGNPALPHATEDFRVSKVGVRAQIALADLHSLCLDIADETVEAIFDGHLLEGKFAPEGSPCRSLGCIVVPARKLKASAPFGKVQVSFCDSGGEWHNFPVTELATRNAGSVEEGVAMLNERLTAHHFDQAALRLGLARAWDGTNHDYDPKRCYLQLNGLILPA